MNEEIKTSSAWAKFCLECLTEINPSYTRNKFAKGKFIEIIRTDESGLVISHNFIKIRDRFYYSFALQFLKNTTIYLYHPLMVGSRFDHNRTIWRQVSDDLGIKRRDKRYPIDLMCSGNGRKNNLIRFKSAMALVEEMLLPFYLQQLKSGKENLAKVFIEAKRICDILPNEVNSPDDLKEIQDIVDLRSQYERECYTLDGFKIARGGVCEYGYGPPTPGFKVSSIPLGVIVLSSLDVFLQERERLNEIIEIAKKL